MGITNESKNIFTNDKHKSNYEFAVKLNQWLLQPLGLWPLTVKNTRIEKFLSIISIIFCIFFFLFLTIPGCLDMMLINDLETGLRKIGPLSFNITNTIKYFLFIIHQNKISHCLKMVFDDWRDVKNQEDQEVMTKSVHTARYFIIICGIFMFGGGLPFSTIFPLLKNSVSTENDTLRNLAFPGHFVIFDPLVKPYYDVVFFLQFVSTLATCSLTCGVCSITILFVIHICGQLQIVMRLLNNLVQSNRSNNYSSEDSSLSYIVERHLRALRFAAEVQKILNEICFVEFLSSTLNICLIGYYVITELEKNHTSMIDLSILSLLLSSYLFNIFIFCYISDMLLDQCEEVGKSAYMIEWNKISGNKARDIILIIVISRRPAKLSAGNMVSFSIECFCSILKASAAYLNVIRTFVT